MPKRGHGHWRPAACLLQLETGRLRDSTELRAGFRPSATLCLLAAASCTTRRLRRAASWVFDPQPLYVFGGRQLHNSEAEPSCELDEVLSAFRGCQLQDSERGPSCKPESELTGESKFGECESGESECCEDVSCKDDAGEAELELPDRRHEPYSIVLDNGTLAIRTFEPYAPIVLARDWEHLPPRAPSADEVQRRRRREAAAWAIQTAWRRHQAGALLAELWSACSFEEVGCPLGD